jgi:hypothetical protein
MNVQRLSAIFAASLVVAACGSDGDSKADEMDAGLDAGDQGDGTDTDGTDTDGTDESEPEPIPCGSNQCLPPEIDLTALGAGAALLKPILEQYGITPVACCAGEAEDTCGATQPLLIQDGTCLEQGQEGELGDPSCEAQSIDLGGAALPIPGCCKPTGQCGFDLGLLGVGCVERTEAARIFSMAPSLDPDAGPPPEVLPLNCVFGPDPEPEPEDAGTDASTPDTSDAGTDAGTGDAG